MWEVFIPFSVLLKFLWWPFMGSFDQAGRLIQGWTGSVGGVPLPRVEGQWVWALHESLVVSVKPVINEGISSPAWSNKVGTSWLYLIICTWFWTAEVESGGKNLKAELRNTCGSGSHCLRLDVIPNTLTKHSLDALCRFTSGRYLCCEPPQIMKETWSKEWCVYQAGIWIHGLGGFGTEGFKGSEELKFVCKRHNLWIPWEPAGGRRVGPCLIDTDYTVSVCPLACCSRLNNGKWEEMRLNNGKWERRGISHTKSCSLKEGAGEESGPWVPPQLLWVTGFSCVYCLLHSLCFPMSVAPNLSERIQRSRVVWSAQWILPCLSSLPG